MAGPWCLILSTFLWACSSCSVPWKGSELSPEPKGDPNESSAGAPPQEIGHLHIDVVQGADFQHGLRREPRESVALGSCSLASHQHQPLVLGPTGTWQKGQGIKCKASVTARPHACWFPCPRELFPKNHISSHGNAASVVLTFIRIASLIRTKAPVGTHATATLSHPC